MATVINPNDLPRSSARQFSAEEMATVLFALELLNEQCPLDHTTMDEPITCQCDNATNLYNELAEEFGIQPLN